MQGVPCTIPVREDGLVADPRVATRCEAKLLRKTRLWAGTTGTTRDMSTSVTVSLCALIAGLLAVGCSGDGGDPDTGRFHVDVHSHAQPEKARVRHVSLTLNLDFAARTVTGTAALTVERQPEVGELRLDNHGLQIAKITGTDETEREYEEGAVDPILGSPLTVRLLPGDREVVVHYRTSPEAEALQWLDPAQTANGAQPFLYTQGQAILTRTWIPLQDSPGVRVTYDADVTAPPALRRASNLDPAGSVSACRRRSRRT